MAAYGTTQILNIFVVTECSIEQSCYKLTSICLHVPPGAYAYVSTQRDVLYEGPEAKECRSQEILEALPFIGHALRIRGGMLGGREL